MNEPLNTAQVLSKLATRSWNGSISLPYDKLSERQQVAIRTALWDNLINFWETARYGRFTLQLHWNVSERLIAVMEMPPEDVSN